MGQMPNRKTVLKMAGLASCVVRNPHNKTRNRIFAQFSTQECIEAVILIVRAQPQQNAPMQR